MTPTDDEQTLVQLQNDWMDAWRRLDYPRLEEILAPEFTLLTDVWIRRNGRWQVVARHSSTPPSKAFTDPD